MLSKDLIEKENSIVFRLGTYIDKVEKLHFYPIKRIYHKKPIIDVCSEIVSMLPYRIDMELEEIEKFVCDKYPNSAFVKYNYAYFGAYPIKYSTNDHQVEGYVLTQHAISSVRDNVLQRGNIFIVQASQLVWRDLGKLSIRPGNIKLLSKNPAKL